LLINRDDLFDMDVIYPFFLMLCIAFMFGDFLTVIPDYSTFLGIENQGVFFTYFIFASMFMRLFFGKYSDKIGRIKSLKIGCLINLIGMLGFLFVQNEIHFYLVATVLGIGGGIISPTLIAFTVDLSQSMNRGKAMSTYFIGLEGGIAIGAFLTGFLYNNNPEKLDIPIYLALISSILAFVLLFVPKLFGIKSE